MTREKMPMTRRSVTHRAVIWTEAGRVKFFITVGLFADGRPGEVFLTCDESGSTLDGFCDCWAIAVSMLLQCGTSVEKLVEKFAYQDFEPRGRTECAAVGLARSVVDYTVRWLAAEFGESGESGRDKRDMRDKKDGEEVEHDTDGDRGVVGGGSA
jgi:ribonucleoside-diphosphate reductase alpha chain